MSQLIKLENTSNAPETRQYLTFTLAGENFAVGSLSVKEIIEYGQGDVLRQGASRPLPRTLGANYREAARA